MSVNWKFEVNLESFEDLFGLARVARLAPSKLASAVISVIDTPEEEDGEDGVRQIDTLMDLSDFYRGRIRPVDMDLGQNFTSFSVNLGSAVDTVRPPGGNGLETVWSEYIQGLEDLSHALQSEMEPVVVAEAEKYAAMTDNLLAISYAYTEFVYPVWSLLKRGGSVETSIIQRWKSICDRKLMSTKNSCYKEFSALIADVVNIP